MDDGNTAATPAITAEPGDMMAATPSLAPQAPAAQVVPEFMRRAESSARWNRPGVRITLAALSLVLAGLLAVQVLVHFRDALSAAHPPLRAPIAAVCALTGCEVQPWRHIESLSIDSTSLSPIAGGAYKLNVALSNKTAVDVAAPWVELSLTDANGAQMARRVLSPEQLSPALKQVSAESEHTLSLIFSTGGQRVSGYNVAVFYP